jgi:pimeloyl-ACP methyl ester carboxylesterase
MPQIQTSRKTIWIADQRKESSQHPALLLIHGAGGTHLDWSPELRRMNAIVPDLPAHGKSEGDGTSDLMDYVNDFVALLDALEIPKVIAVGHSMGGAIALLMALHFPQRLQGLVLLSTGANLVVNPRILEGIRNNFEATTEMLIQWMWQSNTPQAVLRRGLEQLRQTPPDILYQDYVACNQFDVLDQVHKIQLPTLIISGTRDKMTRLEWSEELAENIPNSELHDIGGASHMMALEQPQLIAHIVQDWLTRALVT